MAQIFISHSEEDRPLALEIGGALERGGFTTWYYERDSAPGVHYLDQIGVAVKQCAVLLLVATRTSLRSRNVNTEVLLAYEAEKPYLPVLSGLSHGELQMKEAWKAALVDSTTIAIPPDGLSAILPQIAKGLELLGIVPAPPKLDTRDEVAWAVYARPECSAGDTCLFQVWLYPPVSACEIEELARGADDDAQLRAEGEFDGLLSRGEKLTVALGAAGLEVHDPTQSLIWRGEPETIQYAVSVPEGSQPSMQIARVTLMRESERLNFKLRIKEAAPMAAPEPAQKDEQVFTTYRKAYLCYASEDRAAVLTRAQFLTAAGISFSNENFLPQPGVDWLQHIRRLITEADVFFLFWSEAAKRSRHVAAETKYALELNQSSDGHRPAIVPVMLSKPSPPPPPELAQFHFQDTLAYFVESEPPPGGG